MSGLIELTGRGLFFRCSIYLVCICQIGTSLRAQDSPISIVDSNVRQGASLQPIFPESPDHQDALLNSELDDYLQSIFGGEVPPSVGWLDLDLSSLVEEPQTPAATNQLRVPEPDAWTRPGANSVVRIQDGHTPSSIVIDGQVQPVAYQEKDPNSGDSKNDDKADQANQKTDKGDTGSTLIVDKISTEGLTRQIDEHKKLIEENKTLDEASKTEQLQQLNLASSSLQKAITAQGLIDKRTAARNEFKSDLAEKQKELATPESPMSPDEESTSDELQMQLQEKRQELQEQKAKQDLIQTQIKQRDKRIIELPGLRTAATEQLRTIKQQINTLEQQPHDLASTLALNAKELAAKKESESLEVETSWQEQAGKLLPLERDLVTRSIGTIEEEIKAWEAAYDQVRESEIADQKRQAQEAWDKVINADPRLTELAKGNQELAHRRGELTAKIKSHDAQLTVAQSKYDTIDSKLSTLTQKVDTGMTPANGMLLVEHKYSLMQPFESQAKIIEIKSELQKYRLAGLTLKEERGPLASPDELVRELVGEKPGNVPPQFEQMARDLITTRLNYLNKLENDYENYRTVLTNHQELLQNLVNKISETRSYIDKKALWIRNADPVRFSDLSRSTSAVSSFFNAQQWGVLFAAIKQRTLYRPYETALGISVMLGLFVASRRLRAANGR